MQTALPVWLQTQLSRHGLGTAGLCRAANDKQLTVQS